VGQAAIEGRQGRMVTMHEAASGAGWAVAALALLVLAASAYTASAAMTRVSMSTDGVQANNGSLSPVITPDGRYVAFVSMATNLVTGDTNTQWDIFRHDRQTGVTERVSVSSGGVEQNGGSWETAISADGRYVAFVSNASNLVAGDTNGLSDVFVHDCVTGQTTRVSVASSGAEVVGYSDQPAISADGRYVAFRSDATDLVANDTNGTSDVFVHDLVAGGTTRVNVGSYGVQSTGEIQHIAISADGRYVAFGSDAADLAADDINASYDIFVHDCETGQTECVSVTGDGTPGDRGCDEVSISADGRYVAFSSGATDLVAGDTNNEYDVFVYDRQTGQMERASVTSSGLQVFDSSYYPAISPDGSCVSFYCADDGLAPGDTNTYGDVYVHDRRTGRTERVSVGLGGIDSNGPSYQSRPSTEGRYVAFRSGASNLIAGDTNTAEDIFVCERPAVDFAADVTSGLLPLTVHFTDLSTGEPAFWLWDFGDGSDSGEQDPSHTYNALGTFAVSLTAAGIYGSDTETKLDYIAVLAELAPVADFSADTTEGPAPLTVAFTDLSANGPTSWLWDFGDGNTSPNQHPSHTFSAGTFTVSLTATNGGGSDSEVKVDYIAAVATPAAAFSATPTMGTAPLSVTFTDESTGTIDSWAWDFGDGGTAAVQSPAHEYADLGSYDVSLTVTNTMGSDTETRPGYIHVVAPVVAAFSGSITAGVVPLVVTFTDLSTGDPTAWAWDFGDGHTSMDRNPTHIYSDPGYYTVTLTASKGVVADMDEQVGCIAVGFIDTPADHWAFHSILACATASVVQGYSDYSYKPSDPVTRAQMAAYIARALANGDENVPDPIVAASSFTDVGTDHWAYRYVEYVREQDVVQGYADGSYQPDTVVDRGQMAVYIARSVATPTGEAGVPEVPAGAALTFPDVTADNDWGWCLKHVEYIAGLGIVGGYDDGAYHPEREVTRDQMAVYIQRAFDLPMYLQ
jgi:PKD repeat protein/Tol biopolymer transport system component